MVRLEAIKLCCHLFYEQNSKQLMNIENENIDEQTSLGIFLDTIRFNDQYRLKTSNEQEKIYQYLIEQNSSSILFLCYLSTISEYLSRKVTFHLIEFGLKNRLSEYTIKHILPTNVPIQSIIQYWHRQSSYKLKDFPWNYFHIDSIEQYYSFLFSTYFLASFNDRQQLDSMFHDMKSSLIEYFPSIQAHLLPLLANRNKSNSYIEEIQSLIEKIITKIEYNRLMKHKLTTIIFNLLLTYWNNEENEYYDSWLPEPILPAYNWSILRNTFNYIKQIMNAKTLTELFIKSTVRSNWKFCSMFEFIILD